MAATIRKKGKNFQLFLDALFFLLGGALLAVSIKMFTAPNQIAPGGLTGFAAVCNYLFGLPIGAVTLLCNVPLFLWAWRGLGGRAVLKTAVATVIFSFLIDLLGGFVPVYSGEKILASVFGGVLEGAGLSLAFLRGATTGGTDLAARLLRRRFRHISVGKLMLGVDACIVVFSGFAYRSLESALYAFIAIFISTKVIDTILYGTDAGTGKILYIISEKSEQISDRILSELERGVTKLSARGGYSGRVGEVLLCAVRRDEVHAIHEIVLQTDPNAFLIVGEAGEISGEGFRPRDLQQMPEKKQSSKRK